MSEHRTLTKHTHSTRINYLDIKTHKNSFRRLVYCRYVVMVTDPRSEENRTNVEQIAGVVTDAGHVTNSTRVKVKCQ